MTSLSYYPWITFQNTFADQFNVDKGILFVSNLIFHGHETIILFSSRHYAKTNLKRRL